jgi:hypothetical protein
VRDPALIAELQSLGIDVAAADSPAVVRTRLQARIVRLVTTPPAAYDPALYRQLMQLWEMIRPQPEASADAG